MVLIAGGALVLYLVGSKVVDIGRKREALTAQLEKMFDELKDVSREDGFIEYEELFRKVEETHPEWEKSMKKARDAL